ncbi:MAG: tRNA pseudouridine(38-40) synthase TruA [Bacteroidota bacterium]
MSKNFKIVLEYDGTDFVGWQRQKNGRSVQEVLEIALHTVTREQITVTGAGRTDSGVHARGQVANFHSETLLSTEELFRALNGLAPDDVAIHSVDEATDSFSARYSAKEREYCYYISRLPSVFDRKFAWRAGYGLDIPLMNTVSNLLIGIHDFQSFCKTESTVENYLCNVSCAHWAGDERKIVFTIRAHRFLHGMVRALVGTIVNVGRGFTSQEEFAAIVQSKNRNNAGQTAPPQGLFLERVIY